MLVKSEHLLYIPGDVFYIYYTFIPGDVLYIYYTSQVFKKKIKTTCLLEVAGWSGIVIGRRFQN